MQKNQDMVLDIHEKPNKIQWLSLSLQHLFAMFGSTILVPQLVGLDPGVALLSSGLGTLVYILITRGKVPAYLGSSFAFIIPLTTAKLTHGMGGVLVGTFLAGIVYALVALIIATTGYKWLMKLLPPIVVGPVIMVIGLGLAGSAVGMALYQDPSASKLVYSTPHMLVALGTLVITIMSMTVFKGYLRLIPVLIGIVGGYILALIAGLVDFTPVLQAKWFALPDVSIPFVNTTPVFSLSVVGLMVPVAVVTFAEHIGHQVVLGNVVGKDLVAKPGLHRSILGDGVSIMIASLIGAPPTTTYGENIGVLALTKVFSVYVISGAAVFAILFGFVGKITALISTVPSPVMGGVSILLFGIIASSGLNLLVSSKVDMAQNRNLIIASVVLVLGIGGAIVKLPGHIELSSMAVSAIAGVVLNIVLPGRPRGEEQIDLKKAS